MNTLQEIFSGFDTDKGTNHSYIEKYESLFSKFQNEDVNFLEIGVLYGGSLKMWESYFAKAKIYGIDNFTQANERLPSGRKREPIDGDEIAREFLSYDRIEFIEPLDSLDEKAVKREFDKRKIQFSMIVDDGDHTPNSQYKTFCNFAPYLSLDGIYVIEDVSNFDIANDLKNSLMNKVDDFGWKPKVSIYTGNIKVRRDDILIIIEDLGGLL